MIVSLAAFFLSTFVLISQNRADAKRRLLADHPVADDRARGAAEPAAAQPVQPDPGAHHGHPLHEQRPVTTGPNGTEQAARSSTHNAMGDDRE
jgi:hypothetical protein